MCPLRCPDRTAIRPGGGSARRDAGARDRGERASERGARGTKREISLSPSSTVASARGGGASPSSRERPDHRSAIVSSPRARASETRETRETRRAERVVGGTGRAAMFKAAAASSQANGTSENAGGDLGSSPSWRCATRARRGGGFEVAGRTASEGRRRGRGRGRRSRATRRVDWNNFHPSFERVEGAKTGAHEREVGVDRAREEDVGDRRAGVRPCSSDASCGVGDGGDEGRGGDVDATTRERVD